MGKKANTRSERLWNTKSRRIGMHPDCSTRKQAFPALFSGSVVTLRRTTTTKQSNGRGWLRITKTWLKQRVAAATNHNRQRSDDKHETKYFFDRGKPSAYSATEPCRPADLDRRNQ